MRVRGKRTERPDASNAFMIMDNEAELRDAAERCRRLAGSLAYLDALEMVALAYEYDDRAEVLTRRGRLRLAYSPSTGTSASHLVGGVALPSARA